MDTDNPTTTAPGPGGTLGALAAAQGELGNVAKDARGNYGHYATLAATLAAVLPVLSRHGLALVQLLSDGGNGRTSVTTILAHKDGGSISSTVSGKSAKDTPQGQGSTITYLRRYALMAICGVAPTDDDGQAAEPSRRPMHAVPAAPQATVEAVRRAAYAAAPAADASTVDAYLDQVVSVESKSPEARAQMVIAMREPHRFAVAVAEFAVEQEAL